MIHHTWFRVVLIVTIALIALLAVRLHVAAAPGPQADASISHHW